MEKDFTVHLGGDGVPFLTRQTEVPNYKNGLPNRLKPQIVRKAKVDILDLSEPTQYSYYSQIWSAVGVGVATVVAEDKQWVPFKENWKVFIRWYINGQMDPSELRLARLEQTREIVNHE